VNRRQPVGLGAEERPIFQLTGRRFTLEGDEGPGPPGNRLLLGRGLEREGLLGRLRECLAPSETRPP
jgi:hypothetical protein